MKKLFAASIFIVLACMFFNVVYAGERTLNFTWDQNICQDFAGWHIYQSEESGIYEEVPAFDIPYVSEQDDYNATEAIMSLDGEECIYFFVMTAYDTKGNESIYSNECNVTIDFLSPDEPFSLMIKVNVF